jgi:hypothetical protein
MTNCGVGFSFPTLTTEEPLSLGVPICLYYQMLKTSMMENTNKYIQLSGTHTVERDDTVVELMELDTRGIDVELPCPVDIESASPVDVGVSSLVRVASVDVGPVV